MERIRLPGEWWREEGERTRKRRRRVLALVSGVALGLVALALLAATILAPIPPAWAPEALYLRAFDVRLALGPTVKSLRSLTAGRLLDKEIQWGDSGAPVRLMGGGGVRLAGTVYRPPEVDVSAGIDRSAGTAGGPHPAVLLLHGSTPRGRRLAMYRLLGERLAARGYVVLSLDMRGYGESADPPRPDRPEDYDYVGDALRAIAWLADRQEVDGDRIHVLGHSFGGDVALAAAIRSSGVRSVIALSPARRRDARESPEGGELAYLARREMRYMQLGHPVDTAVYRGYRSPLNVENRVDEYAAGTHPPVLLMDGQREPAADLRFLRDLHRRLAEPKAYVTLAGTDHYLNVADFGPLAVYDPPALEQALERLVGWMRPAAAVPSSTPDE